MKISIPIGAASTLSDLKVWVEEIRPEAIGIPQGHTLTYIRQFNPWKYPDESWDTFRGIPIFYGEEGQLEYKGAPIIDKT